MITLHGEEVKVGDPVWHLFKGWGEVAGLAYESDCCPILVHWEESDDWFTEDGKFHTEDKTPTLFWQPIEFEIPKKPKQKEKAWQWVCRDASGIYWLTSMHHTYGDEIPDAEPIEPYLPSEIERNR